MGETLQQILKKEERNCGREDLNSASLEKEGGPWCHIDISCLIFTNLVGIQLEMHPSFNYSKILLELVISGKLLSL